MAQMTISILQASEVSRVIRIVRPKLISTKKICPEYHTSLGKELDVVGSQCYFYWLVFFWAGGLKFLNLFSQVWCLESFSLLVNHFFNQSACCFAFFITFESEMG